MTPPKIHFRTPAGLSNEWMRLRSSFLFVCFVSRKPRNALKEAVLTEILETSDFLYLLPNTSEMSILPLQEWRVYKHVTHAITPPPPSSFLIILTTSLSHTNQQLWNSSFYGFLGALSGLPCYPRRTWNLFRSFKRDIRVFRPMSVGAVWTDNPETPCSVNPNGDPKFLCLHPSPAGNNWYIQKRVHPAVENSSSEHWHCRGPSSSSSSSPPSMGINGDWQTTSLRRRCNMRTSGEQRWSSSSFFSQQLSSNFFTHRRLLVLVKGSNLKINCKGWEEAVPLTIWPQIHTVYSSPPSPLSCCC